MSEAYDPAPGVEEVYAELHATEGASHDVDPYVTDHAKNRFIERIDPNELYPRTRIEEAFEEAVEVCVEEQAARYNPDEHVAFLYDRHDGTVITCLQPGPGQLRTHCDCGSCLVT